MAFQVRGHDMGVSFKVSKVGTRYKPNVVQFEDKGAENASTVDSQKRIVEVCVCFIRFSCFFIKGYVERI